MEPNRDHQLRGHGLVKNPHRQRSAAGLPGRPTADWQDVLFAEDGDSILKNHPEGYGSSCWLIDDGPNESDL